MKTKTIKNAYWGFYEFLTQKRNSFLFTCVFYALWVVIGIFQNANFELKSFDGRSIGDATYEAFDVGARISMYYQCVALFFISFFGFSALAYFISTKNKNLLFSPELKIINYSSLAGSLLFLFLVFDIKIYDTQEFVYFTHKLMLFAMAMRFLFKRHELSLYQYAILISVSVSLYFFEMDCNKLLGYTLNPDFYVVTFIFACILIIALNFIKTRNFSRIAYVFVPLTLLPVVTFLKDEIFLVMKANNILLSGQSGITFFLWVVLAAWIFLRDQRSAKKEIPNERKLLALSYFPLMVFSLSAYAMYAHSSEFYDEMFEMGNVYLPLMEYKLFGVLAPLEKLSTHLFSDFSFNMLYASLNGLNPYGEISLYDFLLGAFLFLLFYYLIYFISRNEFVALFITLFFPYADVMVAMGYTLGVLMIFAFRKIQVQNPSVKDYLYFFLVMLLLMVWRIDLGFTCLTSMFVALFYFYFRDKNFAIRWKSFFTALLIVAASVFIIIGILGIYRNANFFLRLPQFLNYCMSSQAYGHSSLGNSIMPAYKMQYFIFPAMAGLVLLGLIVNYEKLNKPKNLAYVSLLCICLFYFITFNRGLTRHSLFEGVDSFVSTFIYVILPGSVYVFFRQRGQATKFIAFSFIAFFMISNFLVPTDNSYTSMFEKTIRKTNVENVNLAALKSRLNNVSPDAGKDFTEFVDFINKNTDGAETFIDFCNKPMLYYYAQKETPSWFYQNPLCLQNDFLQEKFIEDLSLYKAPYLLFSVLSESNVMDGVPNAIRHYRLAEYFYNCYKPYVILDNNYCVWRRNDVLDNNKTDTVFSFKRNGAVFNENIQEQINIHRNKHYLVKTVYSGKAKFDTVKASYCDKEISLINGAIADTIVYSILQNNNESSCSFQWNNKNSSIEEIAVLECDYVPDFSADKFFFYDLKKIPYVWGTHDKLVSAEIVLFDAKQQLRTSDGIPKIKVPNTLDKTSGNTILITCKNKTNGMQRLYMYVGKENSRIFTTFLFDIVPSDKEEKYAVRISSAYKWFGDKNNKISFWTEYGSDAVFVSSFQITKGK